MNNNDKHRMRVCLVGDGKLAGSVARNLLNAGHSLHWITSDSPVNHPALQVTCDWPKELPFELAVVASEDRIGLKIQIIDQLEKRLKSDSIIAINTESFPLMELRAASKYPSRIVGLNWCYPADHTFFMEIISDVQTSSTCVGRLDNLARSYWDKDPYIVDTGISVRARLYAAWVREAAYLVKKGYASMESVDRACRNDAGYYLPFAGNFRYMDLMGTYAYGMVMKDLNPELSVDPEISATLAREIQEYAGDDIDKFENVFEEFSKEIRKLILKYPHETFDR